MINTRSTLFLAATVITILNFQSCSKYEDGPAFSLRTKKSRLVGEWEVVKIDGQSPESSAYSLELSFEKNGDFDYKIGYTSYDNSSYKISGEWEFSGGKEDIEINILNDKLDFEILRLTNDELWFEVQNEEWRLETI